VRMADFAEVLRPFVMAKSSISIAIESNRMKTLAQSVKLILMCRAINTAYLRNCGLRTHLNRCAAHLFVLWDPARTLRLGDNDLTKS
jgi:hypothetical protein